MPALILAHVAREAVPVRLLTVQATVSSIEMRAGNSISRVRAAMSVATVVSGISNEPVS